MITAICTDFLAQSNLVFKHKNQPQEFRSSTQHFKIADVSEKKPVLKQLSEIPVALTKHHSLL